MLVAMRPVLNQLRLRLVETSLSTIKTDQNCTEPVDVGSVQFFVVLQPGRTSPGLGLVKFGQKTRLPSTNLNLDDSHSYL